MFDVGYVPAAAVDGEKDKADAHARSLLLRREPGQHGGARRRVCSTSAVRPARPAVGCRQPEKEFFLRLRASERATAAEQASAAASVIVSSVLLAKNYDKDL